MFQFYYDTTPIVGSIAFIPKLIDKEDIWRAIRIGACNVYHMCGHNTVHQKSSETLKALYKSAVFTIQAISYLQTGTYHKQKAELLKTLKACEREIIDSATALKQHSTLTEADLDRLCEQLFVWAADVIAQYPPETQAE